VKTAYYLVNNMLFILTFLFKNYLRGNIIFDKKDLLFH